MRSLTRPPSTPVSTVSLVFTSLPTPVPASAWLTRSSVPSRLSGSTMRTPPRVTSTSTSTRIPTTSLVLMVARVSSLSVLRVLITSASTLLSVSPRILVLRTCVAVVPLPVRPLVLTTNPSPCPTCLVALSVSVLTLFVSASVSCRRVRTPLSSSLVTRLSTPSWAATCTPPTCSSVVPRSCTPTVSPTSACATTSRVLPPWSSGSPTSRSAAELLFPSLPSPSATASTVMSRCTRVTLVTSTTRVRS
mmetsp:Transcript_6795/g.13609  ORF Transcript_6795/g.13609 Transcript_6795/m.13609 type:complete len:248 (+) Transcript_6795:2778-3521(+)